MKVRGSSLSRHDFLVFGGGALAAGIAGCSGGGGAPGAMSLPSVAAASTPAAAATSPATPSPENAAGTATSVSAASVSILRSQTAGAVAPALVGLSYEKSQIFVNFFNAGNAAAIGCFRRLGSSVMRLGGNSVDEVVWAPQGGGRVVNQVAPIDILELAAFVQSAGWRIIYGINFAINTPAAAAAEAAYAATAFGSNLVGFEIGNECDMYSRNGLRPASYTVSDFTAEWWTFASAIREIVPNASFIAPASAYNVSGWTAPFVSSESSNVAMVTQHYYRADAKAATSTMSLLLAPDPKLPSYLESLETLSAAVPLGYRIGECNSLYDGGAPGISNAFGSALWAIDFMLTAAQNGCAGVNFHGGGDSAGYTPIADTKGSVVGIRPEYYGLLLVAQIAPGPMYAVNLTTQLEMTAYAIAGNDGATYVVLVNKDPANAAETEIALGAPASNATSLVLAGQGLSATTGTTLGGAMVSTGGAWSPSSSRSIAVGGTSLTVSVAAASAMLLRIA